MQISDLNHVINSAVVPVVIISSCGLLALAFYNRLAAIVSRIRAFQRERLLEAERLVRSNSPHGTRLLEQLELQTISVRRRANLIRWTLLFLLITIGVLIACCLMLGLSVFVPWALDIAVALFILGLCSMFCSTIFAALELRMALEPVELESRFVTEVVNAESQSDAP